MTPALFPELDDDRAAEAARLAAQRAEWDAIGAQVHAEAEADYLAWKAAQPPDDPDLDMDPGPDRLLQARLPSAGWVRLVENPTPRFDLPMREDRRPVARCSRCAQLAHLWSVGLCDDCLDAEATRLARLNGRGRR
jgi:hypothetical protein